MEGNRGFRYLLLSQAFLYLNIEIWYVVLPFLLLEFTKSPVWMATIFTAGILPTLLFAPIAGAWVDRSHPRQILLICGVARTCLFFLLGLLGIRGFLNPALLTAFAFILGSVGICHTTARRAILPSFASREGIPLANTMDEGIFGFAELAGTVLGALAVTAVGPYRALFLQAAVTAAVPLALAAIPRETRRPAFAPGTHGVGEAFSFLLDGSRLSRSLLGSMALTTLVMASCTAFFSIQIFYYGSALQFGPRTVAWVVFFVSLLGLLGSLGSERLISRLGVPGAMALCAVTSASGLLLLSLSTLPPVVILGAGLALAGGKVLRVCWTTFCQLAVPGRLLGRVAGIYAMSAEGLAAMAGMGTGILAKVYGFQPSFALAAAVSVAASLLYFLPEFRTLAAPLEAPSGAMSKETVHAEVGQTL